MGPLIYISWSEFHHCTDFTHPSQVIGPTENWELVFQHLGTLCHVYCSYSLHNSSYNSAPYLLTRPALRSFSFNSNFFASLSLNVWPFTGAWVTYQGLHAEEDLCSLPKQLKIGNSSSYRDDISCITLYFVMGYTLLDELHRSFAYFKNCYAFIFATSILFPEDAVFLLVFFI